MKTVVSINGCNVGSTGHIMAGIAKLATSKGYRTFNAYPKSRNSLPTEKNDIIISSVPIKYLSTKASYLTGLNGCFAWFSTYRFLRKLDRIKPDIIHLHNLHNSYINLPMLFRYLKKHHIKTIWTLHDCWSFTGHCPHFTLSGCNKWKHGCGHCPQLDAYPAALYDATGFMWKKKKEWFTGIEDLIIVTPSEWLAGLVKDSFLKEYPVKVINNGIDLNVFKPTDSGFRRTYSIQDDKVMLLGVAFSWGVRKGLDVFIELANKLPEKYKIVLVGTTKETDKNLPDGIISIHRTNTQKELAGIYSAADIFLNPTREDNFPGVNIEALACGTPVITFRTGGCPETISSTCGSSVPTDDVEAMIKEIFRITNEKPYCTEACTARAALLEHNTLFGKYIELYDHLTEQ